MSLWFLRYCGLCLALLQILLWPAACAAAEIPETIYSTLQSELGNASLKAHAKDINIRQDDENDTYVAALGTYLFHIGKEGDFSLRSVRFNDDSKEYSEAERNALRVETLKLLDREAYITYPVPTDRAVLGVITVFIDTTCPFSKRFHAEIPMLTDMGVELRFLPYPRDGLKSPGHAKLAGVWCQEKEARQEALTQAIAGEEFSSTDCKDPVEAYFFLGESFMVAGTPTLIFPDGSMYSGYIDPFQVLGELEKRYSK